MNNVVKTGQTTSKVKMVMISEIRKGAKFVHPDSLDVVHVNYKDEECIGYGLVPNLTSHYVRSGDTLWNKAVELK